VLEVNYGPVKFRHGGGFASYATTTWSNQSSPDADESRHHRTRAAR
jgi:hypothetical protein